ncbi:MAG TPA: hypothetical protein PLJ38_04195, partial [bacterium]|nr:hypothetical protein [bacterium]
MLEKQNYFEYSGIIHIHTKHSNDGSGGDFEQVKTALSKTNVDFCIITDHNSIEIKEFYGEQIYNNCTILIGEEITPPNKSHHLLALDITNKITATNNYQENIDNVNNQNGISVICHPNIKRTIFILRDLSWSDWNVNGFTGIELWSYMLDWTKELNIFNIWLYMLFPHWVVKEPDFDIVQRWEEINNSRKCPCFGCVDAHILKLVPFGFNKVFTYEFLFNTIRTNIITLKPLTNNIDD